MFFYFIILLITIVGTGYYVMATNEENLAEVKAAITALKTEVLADVQSVELAVEGLYDVINSQSGAGGISTQAKDELIAALTEIKEPLSSAIKKVAVDDAAETGGEGEEPV